MQSPRIAAVLVAVFATLPGACDSDDSARPSPTAMATATLVQPAPPATATPPTVAAGPLQLTTVPAQSPPPDSSLFVVTGCFQCDGPDETLQRHTTDAAGRTTVTTVMALGHPALDGMTPGHFSAVADGSMLAVVACADEYCGGVGNKPVPTEWRVLVSLDRGDTWAVAYEERVNYLFVHDLAPGYLLVGSVRPDGTAPSPRAHRVIDMPSRSVRTVAPPASAGPLARGMLLWAGQIAWLGYDSEGRGTNAHLFREDGTEIALPVGTAFDSAAALDDGRLAFSSLGGLKRISFYAPGPGTTRSISLGDVFPNGVFRDGTFAVANANGTPGRALVLIDLAKLTATPLVTPALATQQGRNRFIAMEVR